ncbi:MAG: pyruvate kinase, partial [Acidobacteriaceae bacterium]
MNVSLSGPGLLGENPRRARIVATLGPASSNETIFRELLRAGLDVARLNFS